MFFKEKDVRESVLRGKRLLIVDDEPDVLVVLNDEILSACPDCQVDSAKDYEKGSEFLRSNDYDLVVLDIMGVRGFDLLEMAISRKFRVAMLTAHAMNAETLKKSYDLGARTFLPKEKLGEIIPFLEDTFKYDYQSGWRHLLDKLGDFFDKRFDENWRKKTGIPFI